MSEKITLAGVLVHQGLKNTIIVECETPVGTLKLDLPGGQASVDPPSDPKRRAQALVLQEQAKQLMEAEDFEQADAILAEAVKTDPLIPEVYRTWLGVSFQRRDAARIEYAFKQLFVLERAPFDLLHFGIFLGRSDRLEESAVVLEHLWTLREELPQDLAQEAAGAYLVTLNRVRQPARMVEVADEAVQRWGDQPNFLYQSLLGHVLLQHFDHVEEQIPLVRKRIPTDSPIQERLTQMGAAVAQLRVQKKE